MFGYNEQTLFLKIYFQVYTHSYLISSDQCKLSYSGGSSSSGCLGWATLFLLWHSLSLPYGYFISEKITVHCIDMLRKGISVIYNVDF